MSPAGQKVVISILGITAVVGLAIFLFGSFMGSITSIATGFKTLKEVTALFKLDNGIHTIRVEVNGAKNSAAVGIQINLDYIEVVTSSISSEVLPLTVIGSKFSYS